MVFYTLLAPLFVCIPTLYDDNRVDNMIWMWSSGDIMLGQKKMFTSNNVTASPSKHYLIHSVDCARLLDIQGCSSLSNEKETWAIFWTHSAKQIEVLINLGLIDNGIMTMAAFVQNLQFFKFVEIPVIAF